MNRQIAFTGDKTATLVVIHKGQAIKRLCFCPWAISFHHFHRASYPSTPGKAAVILAARHQRHGKPQHLTARKVWLFSNHFLIKATSPPSASAAPAVDRQSSAHHLYSAPNCGAYARCPRGLRRQVVRRVTKRLRHKIHFMNNTGKMAAGSFAGADVARLNPY